MRKSIEFLFFFAVCILLVCTDAERRDKSRKDIPEDYSFEDYEIEFEKSYPDAASRG